MQTSITPPTILDKNKYNTPKYRLIVRSSNTDICCQVYRADHNITAISASCRHILINKYIAYNSFQAILLYRTDLVKFWLEINLNRPVFRIRFILMRIRIRFRDNGSGTGSGSKIEQIPIFVLFFSVKGLKRITMFFLLTYYSRRILNKISDIKKNIYILKKILFVCEFITIFLSYPDPDTFPEVDPDPAK